MKKSKLPKKEPRAVLYARMDKTNLEWLRARAKECGFRSFSAFMNSLVKQMRWEQR